MNDNIVIMIIAALVIAVIIYILKHKNKCCGSCEKCGKVFNLDFAYHKHLDQDVAKKTGFTIRCHQTYFLGLCRECKE